MIFLSLHLNTLPNFIDECHGIMMKPVETELRRVIILRDNGDGWKFKNIQKSVGIDLKIDDTKKFNEVYLFENDAFMNEDLRVSDSPLGADDMM